ncbi:glycosyltransferase family 2 protein [Tabrizicola sp.]|uniref:glycosyltransferase family 2 protein n=1 Tax=Tabrizicola sp. TaxID=2005166 RepID=UPI003F307AD1
MPVQPDFAKAPGRTISIVVPTFRRESYLPPLFSAVAAQIAQVDAPVELVLVDNSPEASAKPAAADAPAFVRYIHEPRTGVAQARNRGVAEARGAYVIFLDDDEQPAPGWLNAFAAAAARGHKAVFGAVEPIFEQTPPEALLSSLDRVFSRRLPVASGQDICHLRAYLGSGNSMFARDVLALVDPPFDISFDSGGEDVWLFRQLVDQHTVPMIWCPEALVREIVPPRRMTIQFLRRRRFNDGQLRCRVEWGARGLLGLLRVQFWMAVGAAQFNFYGIAALVTWPFSAPLSTRLQLTAVGGAGKVFWWLWWLQKLAR